MSDWVAARAPLEGEGRLEEGKEKEGRRNNVDDGMCDPTCSLGAGVGLDCARACTGCWVSLGAGCWVGDEVCVGEYAACLVVVDVSHTLIDDGAA
jgi:hypothetical protein